MAKERRATPLSNDPQEIQKYAVKLGLDESSASFWEVFSLEESVVADFIPKPVYAIMFIYPIGKPTGALEQRNRCASEIPSPVPWYTKQTVSQTCGTIALLHSVMNNLNSVRVKKGSWFECFASKTASLSPEQRGEYIANDEALLSSHEAAAQESSVPNYEECDTHFVAFVKFEGRLWELDGRKFQPLCHGEIADLLPAVLKVVKEQFMPKIEEVDQCRISLCALAPAGA
jgi:hypothetical protein